MGGGVVDFLEPRDPGSEGPERDDDARDPVLDEHRTGELDFYRGNFETAIEHYRRAIRLEPTHYRSHVGLVDSLLELERVEEAIAHVNETLERYNRNTLVGVAGAHAALHGGRRRDAEEYISISREHDPGEPYVWLVQAEVSISMGTAAYEVGSKEGQPAYCYERSLRLAGEGRVWTMRVGMSLLEWDRPAEALGYFEKALAKKAVSPYIYFLCGRVYEALEDFEKAIDFHKRALEIDPAHHRARGALKTLTGLGKAKRWIGKLLDDLTE